MQKKTKEAFGNLPSSITHYLTTYSDHIQTTRFYNNNIFILNPGKLVSSQRTHAFLHKRVSVTEHRG